MRNYTHLPLIFLWLQHLRAHNPGFETMSSHPQEDWPFRPHFQISSESLGKDLGLLQNHQWRYHPQLEWQCESDLSISQACTTYKVGKKHSLRQWNKREVTEHRPVKPGHETLLGHSGWHSNQFQPVWIEEIARGNKNNTWYEKYQELETLQHTVKSFFRSFSFFLKTWYSSSLSLDFLAAGSPVSSASVCVILVV